MSMAGRITTIPEPYRAFFEGQGELRGIWLSAKPDFGVRLVVACLWLCSTGIVSDDHAVDVAATAPT